jgi:hypothetical protein
MASSLAFSPAVKPTIQLSLVSARAVKFDSAFLDRRMREHRMWQNRIAEEATREVICEIADAIECYTGRGPQKFVRAR